MAKLGQKRGPYKPRTRPRPRTKFKKTLERLPLVAAYLRVGKRPSEACRLAGYPESVVRSSAKQIAESVEVQGFLTKQNADLVEQGRMIDPQDLGQAAKVRIQEGISKFKANVKEGKLLLGFSRTGAELAGMLGGPSELHLLNHPQMAPVAIKMMAEMTARILMEKNHLTLEQAVETVQSGSGITLDVEAIKPKPVEQLQAETLPEAPPAAIAPQQDYSLFEKQELERLTADYQRKHARFPVRTA